MYCKHHDKKNQMFHPKQDPIGFECLCLSEERNASLTTTKLALGAEQMKEHKTWVKQTTFSKTICSRQDVICIEPHCASVLDFTALH